MRAIGGPSAQKRVTNSMVEYYNGIVGVMGSSPMCIQKEKIMFFIRNCVNDTI